MSDDAVDWKVALNWTKDDDNFIYGLISFGHTWGSINIFPPFEPYGQMEVTNYETGWKSTFMEGQLLTQLSVYYEDIDGYQASFDTLLTPPNTAGQVKNALTTSTIYGLEFTGQAAVGAWTYDFSASVNESELGTFKDVLHPITGEVGDLSGAPFPYAPDWTASLGVSYTWTLSDGSTLTPRFDYGYVDDAKGELFDDPEFRLPSRGLLNINIRWAQDDSGWYAEAWGTNLTDEKYIAAIQNLGALYYAGPPLQWGVRVGKNF
jgi:iron complex outermembrane receptor protein